MPTVKKVKIKSIDKIGSFNDEYVYDLGISNDNPYFVANNILVHNSCYFSIHDHLDDPYFKKNNPNFIETKESIVELYDELSDKVNDSFPEFMNTNFNTGLSKGGIIKAGRELVAESGLFIKKKKYAVMVYDKEGKRLDTNGSHGEPKIMGLEMKRSDTPIDMQQFMMELLIDLLTNEDVVKAKDIIFEKIKTFRDSFREKHPLDMGSPKRVNGITDYTKKLKDSDSSALLTIINSIDKKLNIPWHVRAGINWNLLKIMNNDLHTQSIVDGQKCIVCVLKQNPYGFKHIAYPVDIVNKPAWLNALPYDSVEMEEIIIDSKLENLFGVLDWDTRNANSDIDNDFFWLE